MTRRAPPLPLSLLALVAISVLAPRAARADATDACIASAEKAQRLRRDGLLLASREALIACARDACPAAIARDCKQWLDEIEGSIPTIVLRVVDARGADVTDARVLVDDTLVAPRVDGRALAVDPGEHTIHIEPAEGPAGEIRVVVRSGERDRVVSVALSSDGPPGRAVPGASWVLGAAGVAALGVGAILWLDGRSARADLYASCGITRTCTEDDKARAQAKLVIGDISFGAGLLAIGAATWIALSQATPSTSTPRVAVAPLSGGGGFVGWSGAF